VREGNSRRDFLKSVAAGAAALSAFPPAAAAQSEGESSWVEVREQFDFTEERVPMNAANLCPSPRIVAERVTELTRDIDRDCSFQNREKFSRLLEETRARVASQLGVSADEVALVRNTSEANNIVNNGVPLKTGDEVVIWRENHPTNNVAWEVRAARYGCVVSRVATPSRPRSADELTEAFTRAFTPRTRILSITHLSNESGVRLPVRELCDAAHRLGIYVHVDGAQTWGALDVNLRALGCDSYSASSHKWFMGPKEAGLLYVRSDRVAGIWPNTVAPGWGNDADPDVKGARKFESLGQRDDACLAALGTAAEFRERLGAARIERRVLELSSALKARLTELGLLLRTPEDPKLSGGVCVIELPAEASSKIFDSLYRVYGIAGATTGGMRLCPHVYNTMEHVDRAAGALKALRHLMPRA
jgi:selenocysteine lyase/cysteine desulfurase